MYGLILFICGMAVMVLELAGVRILSPFLGSSHVVYTSIIGVIMASLSFGYWLGGKLSKKNPTGKKLAILIFTAGLYILALALFQFNFINYVINFNLNVIMKSVLCSLIMFCFPSVLLGIVSPYMIQIILNRTETKENAGAIVGKYYAISTIGSIIGTFLCGFYLIIEFGIDRIFFVLSMAIFVCSLLCMVYEIKYKNSCKDKKKISDILILVLIIFTILSSLFFVFYFKTNKIKIIRFYKNGTEVYYCTTPYNFIDIIDEKIDNENYRYLSNYFSRMNKDGTNRYFIGYIGAFNDYFVNKIKKDNILLLGNSVGCFLSGILSEYNQMGRQDVSIDVVELDKKYTEVGEKYFNLPKNDKRVNYFYEDARTYINRNKNKLYDLIYFDIYSDCNDIFPYYLITKEFYEKIYDMTDFNGMFIINVIGSREPGAKSTAYINQIYAQVNSVFPDVVLYNTNSIDIYNYIIIGYKNPDDENTKQIKEKFKERELEVNEKPSVIFTDKYSPVEKFL